MKLFDLPADQFKTALLLGFGQMMAWATSFYTLGVLAAPMAAGLEISTNLIYAMFSGGLIASGLISPWAGRVMQEQGGRRCLLISNLGFAIAHLILASAQGPVSLGLGWLLMCLTMPFGLYEAAFFTAVGLYGPKSRPLFGVITVVAGLGSTIAWPLSAAIEAEAGWRTACVFWALIQLLISSQIHYRVTRDKPHNKEKIAAVAPATPEQRRSIVLLSLSFVCIAFTFATMATHMPRMFEMIGLAPALAIGAASLFGVAQLSARLSDFTILRKLPPLGLARFAHAVLLVAPVLLIVGGASSAAPFSVLHGIGIGLLTLSKGILPLELFGQHAYAAMSLKAEAFARLTAAISPYLFGLAMQAWGIHAMWLYFLVACVGLYSMMLLKIPVKSRSHEVG